MNMRNRNRVSLVILSLLIISIILSQEFMCLGQPNRPKRPPFGWDISPEELERLRAFYPVYFTTRTIVNTLSSILILGLVFIHFQIYRKTGTRFSLGLVIFSTALFLYTLLANPMVHRFVGFSRIGFGPMLIIPDVFTLIASAILLYLSRQ